MRAGLQSPNARLEREVPRHGISPEVLTADGFFAGSVSFQKPCTPCGHENGFVSCLKYTLRAWFVSAMTRKQLFWGADGVERHKGGGIRSMGGRATDACKASVYFSLHATHANAML
jgi:hypothetical protein